MADCEYPIYTNLWFWLIVIGILFLAIGLIVWDVRSRIPEPWWVWVLIIGGAILFIIGLGMAIWRWWSRDRMENDLLPDEGCPPAPIPAPAPAPVTQKRHVVHQEVSC